MFILTLISIRICSRRLIAFTNNAIRNVLMDFIFFLYYAVFLFFFQAEDGIRVYKVTGVQTCALPIFRQRCLPLPCGGEGCGQLCIVADCSPRQRHGTRALARLAVGPGVSGARLISLRSEERRVGKECRAGSVS